jgi:hypothetical protein
MLKSWQRSGKAEVAALPLPVVDWDSNLPLKDKIARLIVDYAQVWQPDLILDINGAGILPVSGQCRWTPELALRPWLEWWFQDPILKVRKEREAGSLDAWLNALGCPLVKNCAWDRTLAKEYSEWTGKSWGWIPGAVDPELFSPEAAESSSRKPAPADLRFFGRYFPEPPRAADKMEKALNKAVSLRVVRPEESYFDLFRKEPSELNPLEEAFHKAKRHVRGLFEEEILNLKELCDAKAAYYLRSNVLNQLEPLFPSRSFTGDGYPARFGASTEKLYAPGGLSAAYRSSLVSLDLANGQSFSGTNLRVYEIMAAGGVLACNRRPDFDPSGEFDGKAYFHFETAEELAGLASRLRKDPALGNQVSVAARSLIRREHSWLKRLPQIMEMA